MDLNTLELKALRDYLHAVKEALLSSGSTVDDFEEIRSEICAHVASQLGETPYSTEAVNEVVRQLDSPESYKHVTEATQSNENSHSSPKIMKIKPITIVIGALGASFVLLVILAIIFGSIFITKRNQFVLAEKQIDQSEAQVQVVLQRRYDLIPNLVETVKGYAKHESEVLQEVIKLRNQWTQSESPEEKRALSIKLEPSLGKVMAVAEQYPDLKSSQNFIMLQTQLESSENRISIERRRMNLALRDYNALIEVFPGNVVAITFGYEPREEYFEALPEAQSAPQLKF